MLRRLLFVAAVVSATCANAQTKAYFQQEVNYTIEVKLDDTKHMIYGSESFVYTNNSPDALPFIYMHIWPNAYKNRNTALAKQLARGKKFSLFTTLEENKGYIDSLDFKVDGVKATWEYDAENIDICKVYLSQPLQPGQRIVISTPFRVKLPSGSISRLGHIGQSYQITQWYPKPAVYDRNGWHQMPYLNQGEFYSEFGSYDVSITLPKNYIIGATGDCQTSSEVEFMNQQANLGLEKVANAKVNGTKSGSDLNAFPASSTEWKTVRYTQNRVHDFGWFADKRWIVLKGNVETPKEHNQVTTWALFTPESANTWDKSPVYLHDAIYYYSLWNGDYPYSQVTAVDGTISAGGGMEYPNVTVIGSAGTARMLETVIMHEVGHNWFYGILGSNERDNAWMDEGLNSFNEDRYMDTKYPEEGVGSAIGLPSALTDALGLGDFSQRALSEWSYLISATVNDDQALQTTSDNFTSINYGGIVYKKTAILFYYLKASLGNNLFDLCMHNYFDQWKFKHPQPEDLRRVFEETTKQDLGWFFNDLIKTTEKLDFKITGIKHEDNLTTVKVKNVGNAPGPASVNGVWTGVLQPGQKTALQVKSENVYRIDREGMIPEISRTNNYAKNKGLFKKTEPLDLKFITSMDSPYKTELFWAPIYMWNAHDKNMLGLSLHNMKIFQQKFEWNVSPVYSFGRKDVSGFATVKYNKLNFHAGMDMQRFGLGGDALNYYSDAMYALDNYTIMRPFVSYTFKNKPENLNKNFQLLVKLSYQYQLFQGVLNVQTLVEAPNTSTSYREFAQFDANMHKGIDFRQGFDINGRVLYNTNLIQSNASQIGTILSASGSYHYMYSLTKRKDIYVRAFAGYQVEKDKASNLAYGAFGLSGISGNYDYTFDQLFLGRGISSGVSGEQVNTGMGNLGINLKNQGANRRLLSLTGGFQLPINIMNVSLQGTILDAWSCNCNNLAEGVYWNTSLVIEPIKNVWSVTVPIYGNKNVQNAADAKYLNGIMMNLNLTALRPFQLLRSIKF